MELRISELVKSLAASTKAWREDIFRDLQKDGCNDLAYRPRSGMSAIGWLLAHQAAAYDYTLNMLIRDNPPKHPELFYKYRGDSQDPGDWSGHSLQEINEYYDSTEKDFLDWVAELSDKELNSVLEEPRIPQFFKGMRILDVIAFTFTHLNHHNGHLSAIKGDWCKHGKIK